MTAEEYLIGELANKTGVSVRTIRYYISEGLLPSPQSRGRYTIYDEEYIDRIATIKRLKEAFLPIKEIRTMLETKSEAEINEFLSIYEDTGPSNEALDYISSMMDKEKHYQAEPAGIQKQAPMPELFSARSRMPSARGSNHLEDNSVWRRFEIVPGFEVHVREDVFKQSGKIVFNLIESAKKVLQK